MCMAITIIQAIGIIITLAYEAYSLIQTAISGIPATSVIHRWDLVAVFFAFCGFVIWAIVDRETKLIRIRNAKPCIVLKNIDEHFEGTVTAPQWSNLYSQWLIGPSENTKFTRVWVANEPKHPLIATDAIKLYGEIECWDKNTQHKLFIMGGRWAETKEIANGGQPIEIDQLDIPPNGRPYCMDIGLKYFEEDEFYLYNNETPRKRTKGFRDQDRKLGIGTYTLKVRFRCKAVDTSFWFKLENYGKGRDVNFTPITLQNKNIE